MGVTTSGKDLKWRKSQLVLEAEGVAELTSELGPCLVDDEHTFLALFPTQRSEERLLTQLSCSILASNFFFPGHLQLSSERFCFHSAVMGIETTFSVSWQTVKSLLLKPEQSEDAKFGIRGHRVRVTLTEAAPFAGDDVYRLDLRIFDSKALGDLHKCATYFTGFGLFDTNRAISQRSLSLESELQSPASAPPRQSSASPTHPIITAEDLEEQASVWELERRFSMWHRWVAPFLPHDAQKKCKWLALGDRYEPHPALPAGLGVDEACSSRAPPITQLDFLGATRPCRWTCAVSEDTDEDGWQYASDFYVRRGLWHHSVRCWSLARRRRWMPEWTEPEAEDVLVDEQEGATALEETLAGDAESDLADIENLEIMATTILKRKGLTPQAGGSAKQLFDIDIGEVSLEALGAALLQDDWESPNTLMAKYFQETGASDLQISPWARGAVAEKVKGKIRSVEMRVPVPPAPMCPKETRCTSTWHVVTAADRVILESVTMSLDVPYGESFNVVACDTFTTSESGGTRMVRTCGVDWVKSTWMKNMVEANVPAEVFKAGERVAGIVRTCVESPAPASASSGGPAAQ